MPFSNLGVANEYILIRLPYAKGTDVGRVEGIAGRIINLEFNLYEYYQKHKKLPPKITSNQRDRSNLVAIMSGSQISLKLPMSSGGGPDQRIKHLV